MKYLYTGFPPLAYASASTQRLYVLDAAYLSPRRFFCALYMEYLPSLNKSTYGFCGHKYRPTLRVALTGASLPTAPRFLWRHFSRAKTPQDFSARENRMMTRKRTPAYWRMSRTMTLSAPIFAAEKRVCPCQAKVKSPVQTHAGGQGIFFILRFPRWNLTPAVRCLPPPPGGSPRPPR